MRIGTFIASLALVFALPALLHAQDDAPAPKGQDNKGTDVKKEQQKAEDEQKKRQKEAEEQIKKNLKEAEKGCAVAGAGCAVFGIIGAVSFIIWIFILVWVYKDAKSRGDSNAVVWLIVVFLFHLIGLIVYLIARPKGDIGVCRNCQNKMMVTLQKCPHCGATA